MSYLVEIESFKSFVNTGQKVYVAGSEMFHLGILTPKTNFDKIILKNKQMVELQTCKKKNLRHRLAFIIISAVVTPLQDEGLHMFFPSLVSQLVLRFG